MTAKKNEGGLSNHWRGPLPGFPVFYPENSFALRDGEGFLLDYPQKGACLKQNMYCGGIVPRLCVNGPNSGKRSCPAVLSGQTHAGGSLGIWRGTVLGMWEHPMAETEKCAL